MHDFLDKHFVAIVAPFTILIDLKERSTNPQKILHLEHLAINSNSIAARQKHRHPNR
jgi:hypothetical protein